MLLSLLSTFVIEEIVTDDSYKFSESGIYYAPKDGETQSTYIDYIRSLPMNPKPEVYGLHDNADITKDNQETNLVSGLLDLNLI